jgi:Xaa-Pro aminopeptidase
VYPHQHERLTAALAAQRAAALVGTTEANVAYLTGFRSTARLVYPDACALAVVAPSGTALVVPAIDTPAVAEANIDVDHVIPYGRFVFAYAEAPGEIGRRVREWTARTADSAGAALATALTALGVPTGAIALDDGGLGVGAARAVVAALGGRAIVDGANALLEARQVKGPWEIEALERALGIAEEALNAVAAVMGAPHPRHEAVFDALLRGLEDAIAAVRPGATAGELFATAVSGVRAAGLPRYDRHHVGYGIGLDARETPVLEAGSAAVLETGMVLRLETPYYEHGWGGVQVKDTVLVGRSGPRGMNRSRRGLLVLD